MSQYSVNKPVTVLMGTLIIIVLGLFSLSRLPLTLFPDINLPYVVTVTAYPGASPEALETEVTNPIEDAVSTIGFFEEIESVSSENVAISIITFSASADMDTVLIEMRELFDNIVFPEDAQSPSILRISPDLLPVMTISLSREHDESMSLDDALISDTEWITKDILPELRSIPGIADVSLSGIAEIALEIDLDGAKLQTYGLSVGEVLEIIEEQTAEGLIGVVLDGGVIRMLRIGDAPVFLDDMRALPVGFSGGTVVTLSDLVADDGIRLVNTDEETYSKINGMQGIQISFRKQSDVGITEATDAIHARLASILETEEDASYDALFDQGEYIRISINAVVQNMVIGAVLAIIVLIAFLRDLRPTMIVAVAIPVSVVAAFMLMAASGVTLNLVSMGGLALGVGMLVDNAVVVIENIYRMIREGMPRREAAVQGATQVAGAITASTLTTAAVFLPIMFIEGLVAEVFISMALTIAYALGASLLIALTVVPTMSSRMLPDRMDSKENVMLSKAKKAYEVSVKTALSHRFATLASVVLLLGLFAYLVIARGFVMLPESDEGFIDVSVVFDQDVSFDMKTSYADAISDAIRAIDEVDLVYASIGQSRMLGQGMFAGGSGDGLSLSVSLEMDRKKTTKEVAATITTLVETFDPTSIAGFEERMVIETDVTAQDSAGQLFANSGIAIKVSGHDLLTLEEIATDITGVLSGIDHVIDIDDGIVRGEDNVKVTVDREQAIKVGLTTDDVSANILYLFANLESLVSTSSIDVTIEGVTYPLSVPETLSLGDPEMLSGITYRDFLSGVLLFSDPDRALIDAWTDETGQGIYVDALTYFQMTGSFPVDGSGNMTVFAVNPDLKVFLGEITDGPSGVPLASRAVAPLLSDDPSTAIASITKTTGFASIATDGTTRYLTVTAAVAPSQNVTLVSSGVTDAVNTYLESDTFKAFGGGYDVTFEGESEEIIQAVEDLSLAAFVAILLVYMVMAIQFQSLIYPLIILATVPLAFTGGLIALFVTGGNISLVALMGFIILIGIVVNNGIVLIDTINKLRASGMALEPAIIEAGKMRLRPIFMTALTTILALVTLAMGFGQGSELLQPMAATAIGGLFYATILTLVVVPVMYALMSKTDPKDSPGATDVSNG
jgi:multidrug efflux pump subunit AcrB